MMRFSITITRKRALMVIFAAVSIMIIDSTIVKYIVFSTQEFTALMNVSIFISLALLLIGVSVVILGFIAWTESDCALKGAIGVKNCYFMIFMNQVSFIAILTI